MKKILLSCAMSILVASCAAPSGQPQSKKSLTIKGSDTEVQLVSNLAEAFDAAHAGYDISVTGGGSATGIASLLNREDIDIANSSRSLSDEEKKKAADANIVVQEFVLAKDGLSVIVHPKNSIKQLSVDQLGSIFSGVVTNWKDVGGADAPIVLYGRQSTSGTYKFFRDTVVKADYATSMRNMEGNQAIVDAVKNDENGIGYVGVGYVKDAQDQPRTDIGILSLLDTTQVPVSPLDESAVRSGHYPISRNIYQYVVVSPANAAVLKDFFTFESSAEGQQIIKKAGFYAISADDAAKNETFVSTLH